MGKEEVRNHITSTHAPTNAQKNSDITKAEIEAKLTGVISSHSHTGGGDPWTNVILGSDFTISTTSNNNVTGLNFTPSANTRYLVEVSLLLRTATATTGPRPGFSWPAGLSDGGAWMQAPNSATVYALRSWGPINTQNAASTGLPDTTSSHLAIGGAYFITGGSPSGNFQVTLASETAAVNVTMRAGSFIRYRTIS